MSAILIVEDEISINTLICKNLTLVGHKCTGAYDGTTALQLIKNNNYDLIILDVMLPGFSGFEIITYIKDTPVIFVTARSGLQDKLKGLELGADDYIIKPFDSKELVARVKAVLRRYQVNVPAAGDKANCVEYPDLIINITNYSVIYKGQTIDMPPKELELLFFLASSPNQVFTREQLLDHIWGYEYIGDTRTVDVHVKRVREKIHDHEKWNLSTVWGIGYKFEVRK